MKTQKIRDYTTTRSAGRSSNVGAVEVDNISIRGIIFDKDGTLIKFDDFWRPVTEKAVMHILRETKMPAELKEEMMSAAGLDKGINGLICRGTYSQMAEEFEKVLKKYRKDIGKLEKLTVEAFTRSMPAGKIVPACIDIQGLLKELKKCGRRIFLVTTDCGEITKKCLKEMAIEEYFDEIFTDDGGGCSKPDPYYINKITDKYALKKSELIMVGDTVTDMEFAANGGIKAVGVAAAEREKRILGRYTDIVIDNISYLTKIFDAR